MNEPTTFEEPGLIVHPLGIEFGEDYPIESWVRLGPLLKRSGIVAQWRLADWLAHAIRKSKEEQAEPTPGSRSQRTWTDALKAFKESEIRADQTIWTLASVARSFPIERRRDNIESLSFYRELAPLKATQQTKWLDRIEKENLSVSQFRRLLRQSSATRDAEKVDHEPWDSPTLKCRELVNWLRSKPSDFWTPLRKQMWAAELKPLAEFYAGLVS